MSLRSSLCATMATVFLASTVCFAQENGEKADKAVSLENSDQSVQLQNLGSEQDYPLTIGGYAVGNFAYDGRAHDNSFSTGKVAVSFFKQADDNIWFFGQLTTSMSPPSTPGGDATTDIEIDDFMMNYTPPGVPDISLTFGRYAVPIGFEMDDEVLNLQSSNSLDFQYGRPSKMTGFIGRYTPSPEWDIAAYISNGWDMPFSNGTGKTGGGMVQFLPAENISFSANGMYGSQPDGGIQVDRFLSSFSCVWQPTASWIIGGEFIYGGQKSAASAVSGHWAGGYVMLFRQFGRHFGATIRGEGFDDINGLRTGQPQTIRGITFTPSYFIGTGQEGIFANIERTTFRIPRFQIRAEVSVLDSTSPFFADGTTMTRWSTRYSLQMIVTL